MTAITAPCYLANAICVASFKLDHKLRYKVKEIEQSFLSVFSAQAIGTNVPDSAPPEIPRFTLQNEFNQISITQLSAQLDLNFRNQNKTYNETTEIIHKNFKNFLCGVFNFKSPNELTEVGMVITINRPLELSQAEVSQKLFDQFIKFNPLGNIASTSFQVGFLDKSISIFYNISANYYEMREATFDNVTANQPPIMLDFKNMAIKESGIELKLDVNSRPMFEAKKAVNKELGGMLFGKLKNLVDDYKTTILKW